MTRSQTPERAEPPSRGLDRKVSLGFLAALTALGIYLCWLMAQPFLSALTWAVAIAVIAGPLHRWLEQRVPQKNLAALLAVTLVVAILIVPSFFLVQQAVAEAVDGIRQLQAFFTSDRWRELTSEQHRLGRIASWLDENLDLRNSLQPIAAAISRGATRAVWFSIQSLILLVIMLFILFYFFRDRRRIVASMVSLAPLPDQEIKKLLSVTADAIHAAIYGRFVIASIQGGLGGVMFWILGIHAPLLWTLLMTLFCLVPMLGAFVIWVPAAVGLAIQGSWVKALILTVWGSCVIGLIDNFLYPLIVGDRLQMHPLLIFFSALGGVAAFGASGIIVGPVILSVFTGVLQLWRLRLEGRDA